MSDAFEQIAENGVILKNLDTSQRPPIRPVDRGYDSGDILFSFISVTDLKIDTAGLATAFDRIQVLTFAAAQRLEQQLVAVFAAQIRFIMPGDDFGRVIQRNDFTIRCHNHHAHGKGVKNVAEPAVMYKDVIHLASSEV